MLNRSKMSSVKNKNDFWNCDPGYERILIVTQNTNLNQIPTWLPKTWTKNFNTLHRYE